MKIRQIKDNDPELYGLIVPLVMNPKVLKSNNNYPFKNFREQYGMLLWEMVIFPVLCL